MAEEPEEVLPEQRVAAVRDVEEVEAEPALQLEEDAVGGQCRQREDQRQRRGEDREAEERHAVPRHAWCAPLEGGDDQVECAGGGRGAAKDEPERGGVDGAA